jgi:hypothetical protein
LYDQSHRVTLELWYYWGVQSNACLTNTCLTLRALLGSDTHDIAINESGRGAMQIIDVAARKTVLMLLGIIVLTVVCAQRASAMPWLWTGLHTDPRPTVPPGLSCASHPEAGYGLHAAPTALNRCAEQTMYDA